MITRIVIAFILFAGLAYYFNIDVRAAVDKTGVPAWLTSRGVNVNAASSTSATTTP